MNTEKTLTITNDGPRIVATNYWETDHARAGKVYCSVNAGAIRILPGAGEWIVSAWLPGPAHVFERPAKWRRVKRLPWLKPWK